MKMRVFELARSKNLPISEAVQLLSDRGVKNASAVTFVEQSVLDDVPPRERASGPEPAEAERPSTLARNILGRGSDPAGWTKDEPRSGENPAAYVALGLSLVALVIVAFVFFSERSNHVEISGMQAEINLLKASNAKVEDVVISNRAQILDTRDQVVAMEKRFYEFKRTSLMAQLKSQGVVLKALSEGMREPLKSKTLALANGLATF
jgi:hypothetical protein